MPKPVKTSKVYTRRQKNTRELYWVTLPTGATVRLWYDEDSGKAIARKPYILQIEDENGGAEATFTRLQLSNLLTALMKVVERLEGSDE